jgi:hypothetical protein
MKVLVSTPLPAIYCCGVLLSWLIGFAMMDGGDFSRQIEFYFFCGTYVVKLHYDNVHIYF